MGLARLCSTDPLHNVLITITTLEADDGTPIDPVAGSLTVTVAFPLVGGFPDAGPWRAADWVAATDGTFRVRCQVGTSATGVLAPGQYQPYVRVVNGPETITVAAADVLESY